MQSHLAKIDQLNTTESESLAQQGDSWIDSLLRVGSAAVLGHRQSRGTHFGSDIQHVSTHTVAQPPGLSFENGGLGLSRPHNVGKGA